VKSTCSKQKIVSKSSTESEIIAASDSVSGLIGLSNYLLWRGHSPCYPRPRQYVEPISLDEWLQFGEENETPTHPLFLQNYFNKSGELKVKYLKTNDMVADVLTKPLQGQHFKELRNKLLGYSRSLISMKIIKPKKGM
jgi:hypothetical protein